MNAYMASSNLLSRALFLLLLTHAISATDTSFDFPFFKQNDPDIILQGDANVSSNGNLQLTKDTSNGPAVDSMGRAFYYAPVQIKNRTTGKVASFDTNFTFNSAYHLAFALFSVGPLPFPPSATPVAVVFNTVSNRIEIYVNSKPVAMTPCNFGKTNGEEDKVLITYDSSKNNLRVSLVYPPRNKCDVSATVHLAEEVHDSRVNVGFSATSGLNGKTGKTNNLLSWSFASHLSAQFQKSERSNILLNNIL